MSAIDPDEWRGEFDTEIEDWWAQLWALRISAVQPMSLTRERFILFVHSRCAEVGSRRLEDTDLSNLFSDFLDKLSEGEYND